MWRDLHGNPDREPWRFEPSLVVDFLSFGSVLLFIFLGSYFAGGQILDPASASHINPTALAIVKIWTLAYTDIFILRRHLRVNELTANHPVSC